MSEREEHTTASENDVFLISRTFGVDRETMFKLWTKTDELRHWWGPKGFTVKVAKINLHPGGIFHYCLEAPDGSEMWGKFVFREVAKPKRLVFVSSFSDDRGGLTRHPLNPNWPRETLSKVTMVEEEGRTTVTVQWSPINATETERDTFRAGQESMQQGWTGTFDQLEAFISSNKETV